MSAITAKASRKMKKYAVLTREPRCFLGSFDFSWEQRKLGELGTITTGSTPSTSIPDYYSDDGIVWVTPTDICENITFESARKLSDLGQQVGRVVPKNTILVTCIASIGKNTMLGNTGSFNQQINGLTPNEKECDPYFLLTESALWSAKMKSSAAAGTMQIVNRTEFSELKTWLPNLIEQQAISDFFRQLDNLITLHQRQPFLHSTPHISLSVQLIHPIYTSSWEQRKAKELFVSTADKGYPELPVLSATQDRGMIRRDENSINIFHDKKNEAGYKRVLPGQFVIHLRSFQGGFAHSAIEGITSPAYTVFGFSEPEKHDSEYWKYVFTSKSFIQRLETVTYGIRDGRSISYEEFLTLGFVYPSKAEQTAIARYLDKLSDLITLHQRKGKAAVTGCSNDANNSKGVCCKARDFGYKCHKKDESQ